MPISLAFVPPSAQDLVRLAGEHLGADTPTALARALQLDGYHSPNRVRRWLEGRNEPRYDETVLILERLGVLDWSKLDQPAAPADSSTNPAEGLAGGEERVLLEVRLLADRLSREIAELRLEVRRAGRDGAATSDPGRPRG